MDFLFLYYFYFNKLIQSIKNVYMCILKNIIEEDIEKLMLIRGCNLKWISEEIIYAKCTTYQ